MDKPEEIIENWGTPYEGLNAYIIGWGKGKYAYIVCDDGANRRQAALWLSKVKSVCPRIAVIEQESDTEITLSFIKGLKESLFQALRWG